LEVLEKIMNTSSKDFELIKIILEDATSYFEDKSGNDFYLEGDDSPERFNVFREIIETQADEEDKELLENLTCWTYDIWVVRYLIELTQINLNRTQLEMCLLLLEEINQVPGLLNGTFRFELSELESVKSILKINNIYPVDGFYFVNDSNIVEYLINKIGKIIY